MRKRALLPLPFLLTLTSLITGCGSGGIAPGTEAAALADNPAALAEWTAALAACHTKVVNVVILGDSRSILDDTTIPGTGGLDVANGNKWPDLLRTNLQSRCGSHGTGLIPLIPGVANHAVNANVYTLAGTWHTSSSDLGPSQSGTTLALDADTGTAITFSAGTPFDHINTYCTTGPGLQPWTLTLDGHNAGACGGASATSVATLTTSAAVALATHTVVLQCATGPCEAYGLEAIAGTNGLSVHNLAAASCAAECFGTTPAAQLAFSDLIPGGQQLIIGQLITNDANFNIAPAGFQSALAAITTHAQALSGSPSVLWLSPLQDGVGNQGPYYPLIEANAQQFKTAFYDLRWLYGTGLNLSYFGPDMVHENTLGHSLMYQAVISVLTP